MSTSFHRKLTAFVISKNTDIDCIFNTLFLFFFNYLEVKDFYNKHGCNFDDVGKIDYVRPS